MNWKTIAKARSRLENETGAIIKDWGGKIAVALVYPNAYFLGMSNLGFQTLYGLLNQHSDIVCERVFWEEDQPVSLESQRPLGDFDVLAFSLSYELDYFNVPKILRQGEIPVFATERREHHPLVIAGGAAVTANPMPLAPLFDCFAIGEGEAILPRIIPLLAEGLNHPRQELLQTLSQSPGIYVPIIEPTGQVARQRADDISGFATTSTVLTPDTELGDLYLMEIARGCSRGCRFCLSGYHFRPMRYRPVDRLLEQARKGLEHRQRMGLVSAAISDHPQIDQLATGLLDMGATFSVSSIRIKPLSDVLIQGLVASGTRTVTLAPEAGSERLRRVISKGISNDDILRAVETVSAYGLRQIKLYFMIGLPTETPQDIEDIVQLALSAKAISDRYTGSTHLTVNVTPFVPKAGTPFQWQPMARATIIKDRISMLQQGLRGKGIAVKADSPDWMLIQGMLSRGGANLGPVIADMTKTSLAAWKKSLKKAGIDPETIHRELPISGALPWSVIDSGTSSDYLRMEMERAVHL